MKRKLEQYLAALMEEYSGRGLSSRMRILVADMRAQWRELDRRITAFDGEFVTWARENVDARRLASIPGVGVMIATALIAAIGRAESFARGRDLAAWLGLAHQKMRRRLRIWSNSNRYGSATSLLAAMMTMSWEKTEALYQLKPPSRTT